jgi:hypothetical protein
MDREPAPVCPVPTELSESSAMVGGFEGVDMLVVVDNSRSMQEEQNILATAFFPLINALVNPLPDWPYAPADDVRVAIVSSDMGLQWGGHPYDGPVELSGCDSDGDDGEFQTYGSGKTIDIQHDAIPCDGNGSQCPTGWSCSAAEPDQVGRCLAPDGDGSDQPCPGINSTWVETPLGSGDEAVANDDLAFEVACLSALGTEGCGFEQQLQAAAVALHKPSQADFVRDDALLSVLIVSDEEDCSIESEELFGVDEITDSGSKSVNLACGNNEQYLYDAAGYKETFEQVKGDRPGAVVFAAIAGVPPGAGDDPSACEGSGSDLGECLDQPEMNPDVVEEDGAFYFEAACARWEGDELITRARPGRRYVELAERFDELGYAYSICREDWSPAMEDIARLIAENLAGTCYPKPLDWDPATRRAKCDVVAEFVDAEQCPFEVADGAEVLEEHWTDGDGVERTTIFCPLPQLAVDKQCSADQDQALAGEFGWYYCENMTVENFDEACGDNLDNDGDGLLNCDDPECESCPTCGGNGVDCEKTCKYVLQLTDAAENTVHGQNLSVQCLTQFSFEDPNCQERTSEACNNGDDDDGNGIWDCDDDFDAERPHSADHNCCPMEVGDKNECVVKTHDACEGSTDSEPSDACRAHANLLGCIPPWT